MVFEIQSYLSNVSRKLSEKKAQYQIDLEDVDNVRSRKYQKSDSVIVQGTGDKSQLIFEDDLRPNLPIPTTSKSTRKPQSQSRGKRNNLRSSIAQAGFVNRVRKSINSSQQSSMQPKTMTPEPNRQLKQPVSFANDNQSPYVSPQNTRSFVRDDSQSPIKKRQYTMMTRKTLQMQKGNYQPQKYFQLKPDDDQSFQQYFELMQDPINRRMYAKMILDAHQRADIQITELATMLSQSTLRLFCNLRDKLITLEQFKARIVEREMNLKYTCIDDLGEYLKKTSQSHKNSSTGLGIKQFRTTKGDEIAQNSARQTTSSSRLLQDQRASVVDPKWKRQYEGVADRSEIMYKKKFSDVTIGQILQPRQPWKTNKRCLRSIISLSRPRTALPAKKRNNIVFDQKKMQQQQQQQKRDNNDSNLGKKKKYKSILDDQILGTTKVNNEQQTAKKRLEQQSSGDFNSRSRINILQAAIANTSQSIQESFKSGQQNNLQKQETQVFSSQSNKKLKNNISEGHDIYQNRAVFLSNRGSQRHSKNSSQIPDPFKYTKASSAHQSSKKKRRALSKPQSTVMSSNIKKKDSLAFLNRFEELNQIVIRQPEQPDQSVNQDRDRQETKEILRKATSGVGYRPNLSQPQIEDDASSTFYLKNNQNKYMSQTSISSQYRGGPVPGWPSSPFSTQSRFKNQDSQIMQQQLIDQDQTSSKVVMDVNSMGGVSNSFKSFIRRLGVPVLRNIKTVIGSDGNRRMKEGQLPQKSFSQLSSPYASVPYIHNQQQQQQQQQHQYQSAANYKRIINNQSNLSFQSTAFSNSGDYKTKAIYHRLGLNKVQSQLNYTFF